jgi:hypothetical protein
MKRFIQRDFTRTEHDDFVLNVECQLTELTEAVPVTVQVLNVPPTPDKIECVGWNIGFKFE